MTPFDEQRPRTPGGAPAWRDAPHLALPSLVLTPTEHEGVWDLKFMFPSQEHSNAFHWIGGAFAMAALQEFFADWFDGPELAVMEWFKQKAPSGKVWRIAKEDPGAELETNLSAEELGL